MPRVRPSAVHPTVHPNVHPNVHPRWTLRWTLGWTVGWTGEGRTLGMVPPDRPRGEGWGHLGTLGILVPLLKNQPSCCVLRSKVTPPPVGAPAGGGGVPLGPPYSPQWHFVRPQRSPGPQGCLLSPRGDTGDTSAAGRHARGGFVGRAFSGGLFSCVPPAGRPKAAPPPTFFFKRGGEAPLSPLTPTHLPISLILHSIFRHTFKRKYKGFWHLFAIWSSQPLRMLWNLTGDTKTLF